MHQREDGLWVMEDLLIVPDYMRFVPPWMTVDEFIETLGKIQ
jgi:hypothetical protein